MIDHTKKLSLIMTFLLTVTPTNYGMEDQLNSASFQKNQNNILLNAAQENNCSMIRMMLDNGVDINVTDDNGNTALACAAYFGCKEAVECLLSYPGIKIDQESKGYTPLVFAIQKKNKVVIKQLLDAGADPVFVTKTCKTPRKAAIHITYSGNLQEALSFNRAPRAVNSESTIESDAEILSFNT